MRTGTSARRVRSALTVHAVLLGFAATYMSIMVLSLQDANLRRALRTAGPRAAERITLEIETVGAELEAATARLNDLQLTGQPIRITKKLVDDTIAQFEGILERAPLETRVATVRDLFERVDVDSRELKAVAVWNMTTDHWC